MWETIQSKNMQNGTSQFPQITWSLDTLLKSPEDPNQICMVNYAGNLEYYIIGTAGDSNDV